MKDFFEELNIALKILIKLEDAKDYLTYIEIAGEINVSDTKKELVIKKLKDAKILNSSSGNKGGYFLTETVKDMRLNKLYEILINKENNKEINIDNIDAELNNIYIKIKENIEKQVLAELENYKIKDFYIE